MQIKSMFVEDGLRTDYRDRPIADNCFYYAICHGGRIADELVFAEDDSSLIDYMVEERISELSKQELHFLSKAELGKIFDDACDYVIVRYDEYYDTLLKQDEQKKKDEYDNRRMQKTLARQRRNQYV